MKTVSLDDLTKQPKQTSALAHHEPITVKTDTGSDLVLLSRDEYARLKQRDQAAFFVGETPDWLFTQMVENRVVLTPKEESELKADANS